MKREMCVKNGVKNLCPHIGLPTGVVLVERCSQCKLPSLYLCKGKVPETSTQMITTEKNY